MSLGEIDILPGVIFGFLRVLIPSAHVTLMSTASTREQPSVRLSSTARPKVH